MSTSSPYFRSFVIGGIWFLAIGFKMVSRHSGPWSTFQPTKLIIFGFVYVISALLLGVAASRFEKLRSWWAMGMSTVVGWFVVMGLMLIMPFALYPPKPEMPSFKSTDERMVYFAHEVTKWVKKDRGLDLDYSIESIKVIEEELGRIAKEIDKNNPPKGTFGTAVGYGAYVGEALRRRDGGSWAADHPTAGQHSYPLTLKSNVVVFPVSWCWKRLINGEEDNVYHKVAMLGNSKSLFSTNVLEGK